MITADDALQRLLDGNHRYVANQMTVQERSDAQTRKTLIAGQSPYAIILCCSDSRVPPEIIFDQGLGEIFVVRVAGNVPDPIILGSVEYAADHLGSPLIMVLGHGQCGAVTAAVHAEGHAHHGNVGAILKTLAPAVSQAKKEAAPGKDNAQLVEAAIDVNVGLVCRSLTEQSGIIKDLVEAGKVKIVGAKYDLHDGLVRLFEGK